MLVRPSPPGWLIGLKGDEAHVLPDRDVVTHHADDCVCGPTTEPVERADGSIAWVVIHHSLDGREAREAS